VKIGDNVKIKNRTIPCAGMTGKLVDIETEKLENTRYIVLVDGDDARHYYYEDELEIQK